MTAGTRDLDPGGWYATERDREFRCPRCGARCTRTPNCGEVGHKYGCQRRPEDLPEGGANGTGSYAHHR